MEAAANLFQARREHLKWSRAKLAGMLGVSEMSVFRIEKQGQRPEPELLARLVRVLSLRWDDVERALLGEISSDEVHQIARRAVTTAHPGDDLDSRIAQLTPDQRRVFRELLGLLPEQESS